MSDYATYRAARERLRRLENGEGLIDVYGYETVQDMVDYEKVTIYDALHDREPATVEWCKQLGSFYDDDIGTRVRINDAVTVWDLEHGGLRLTIYGLETFDNPMRGQVLMLIEVLGEGK